MALIIAGPWLLGGLAEAAEFSTRIVDGLGRPVPGAEITFHWLRAAPSGDVRKIDLLTLHSDETGRASGSYDEGSVPPGQSVWVYVGKPGHGGYYSTSLSSTFVLQREFDPSDLLRAADLPEAARADALRECLAGRFVSGNLHEMVFLHERELRPALKALLRDPVVGPMAIQLISYIGFPEDMALVVESAPQPSDSLFENRWAYAAVTALLEPSSGKEWEFLRQAALNRYNDRWVDAGAIQTLELVASERSAAILMEVEEKNEGRREFAARAIQYIRSGAKALDDGDLTRASEKVAQAVRVGQWMRNGGPKFNRDRSMALVDLEFVSGRDLLVYTATFHKVDDVWRLRGVRETMQALLSIDAQVEPRKGQP